MDTGLIRPTGLGNEHSAEDMGFHSLSGNPDHQRQTNIVIAVFCTSLVAAVALTVAGFLLRRRYRRKRAAKEERVKTAISDAYKTPDRAGAHQDHSPRIFNY
ncbi:hypothetical protein B0I35DRAFT_507422 [Stachybotrys elegans]|uniref:Uncharacterized protein n=1 Tax=Stachybotrys elegans TaxID=80388 RepID=A0A8K0T592_9HYPO|nr:hypothetical protein B0I35DRAFT_507422 [Stachybotrys elegans]